MAEEHESKETGAATIAGKDPKKRQMIAIGIGGVLLLVVYMLIKSKGAAATGTTPVTGVTGVTASDPNALTPGDLSQFGTQFGQNELANFGQLNSTLQSGFGGLSSQLAAMDTSQPGAAPQGSQDLWFGNHDAGQYMYGQAQLAYLKSQIGNPNGNVTQQIYNQVVNAYNVLAAKAPQIANEAHYSIVDNTGQTIEAIPPDVVDARQIYTIHLSGNSPGSGGTVDMGSDPQPWPTIWPQQGIMNPNATPSQPAYNTIGGTTVTSQI